ncbi:VirK/YbjX family protein [Frateuria defendens]|uniref:VirK/YbjX family protein n=1 Tax=Frateuria defendens TaxID=2219559 RepID=UPI00066FFAB7|nr:DUF535 family protein [Frateuria defendens]
MDLELFFRSFRARADWGNRVGMRRRKAAKYAWRCLLHGRRQARWLRFLDGHPLLRRIVTVQPRLHERWHHAYVSRQLGATRRLAVAHQHYAFLLAHWPAAAIEAIYLHEGLPLGTLELKDGSHAHLALRRPVGKGTEGELGLYLFDDDGQRLCSLVFTIAGDGLLIGCVQGAYAHMGAEAARRFTRQSHGLRPKNLLLSVLYALAAHHGMARVRGVGNAAHPFAGQLDRECSGPRIKTDYDAFWVECGGRRGDDGFYELPPREPLRDPNEVESKHRSAFRKREQLRRQGCHQALAALGLAAPAGEDTALEAAA